MRDSAWEFFTNILCEQGVIIGISNLNTLGIEFHIYICECVCEKQGAFLSLVRFTCLQSIFIQRTVLEVIPDGK